jgi:hypothetical protein
MLRVILSVVVGYVVMAGMVMGLFSIAYLSMGTERAFKPGTYDVSMLWCLLSLVLGFGAAIVGGLVAGFIARRPSGPTSLAILILVLGVLFAIPVVLVPADDLPPRDGDVSNFDAMQQARQPAWVALLNPVVGAVGVLLGGRLVSCPKQPAPADAPESPDAS